MRLGAQSQVLLLGVMSDDEYVIARTARESCPWCGKTLNALLDPVNNAVPSPGDWTLCWGCHRPLVIGDGGRRRRPTPDEAAEILADPTIQEMRELLAESPTPLHAAEAMHKRREQR